MDFWLVAPSICQAQDLLSDVFFIYVCVCSTAYGQFNLFVDIWISCINVSFSLDVPCIFVLHWMTSFYLKWYFKNLNSLNSVEGKELI